MTPETDLKDPQNQFRIFCGLQNWSEKFHDPQIRPADVVVSCFYVLCCYFLLQIESNCPINECYQVTKLWRRMLGLHLITETKQITEHSLLGQEVPQKTKDSFILNMKTILG